MTRAYSPFWFGGGGIGRVLGWRVGSGFDKFLYGLAELDGTWKDPARLPHSRLGQKNARHLPLTATPGIARHSHTWLIERLSHNPS